MDSENIAAIARGLTKAQRAYILAHTGAEYYNRHGVTANWALRHGYADTLIHLPDGTSMPWANQSLAEIGSDYKIGGQVLTPLGLAVRQHLLAAAGDA